MPLRDCYIVSVGLMVWTGASDVVFIKSTTEGVRCSDAKVSGDAVLSWMVVAHPG
jgi:hypothetical protein